MFETIVAPDVVLEHLDDPQWVVVDCRHSLQDFELGRRSFEAGHIPGAAFADVENDLAGTKTGTNGRHPLPDPNAFAGFLRSLGVGDRTQVVAYDEGADMYAPRLWFLCRWIGHDAAAVLDGGISLWRARGYPVERGGATARIFRSTQTLSVRVRPELVVTSDDVAGNLGSPAMQLLDARAAERFRGDVEPMDPVAGHIPGARNFWFKGNFGEGGRLKGTDELRRAYQAYGEPSNIVHQCGSGISSAANMLAMEHAGMIGSRLYAGSWSEWCADPLRPVVTGDA